MQRSSINRNLWVTKAVNKGAEKLPYAHTGIKTVTKVHVPANIKDFINGSFAKINLVRWLKIRTKYRSVKAAAISNKRASSGEKIAKIKPTIADVRIKTIVIHCCKFKVADIGFSSN
jgi:hypothetical protein